jgi:hypothetical protein
VIHPLLLGEQVGIRDLTTLEDGRLIVLTGPSQEQSNIPYGVFLVDLTSTTAPKYLASLSPVLEQGTRGKAEGIVVLEERDDAFRVLVMFDSLDNGGPREYRIPIQ